MILTRTGYGSTNLIVTISYNGSTIVVTKPIDLGYPTPDIFTNVGSTATFGGCYQFNYLSQVPGTTYKWQLKKMPSGPTQTVSTAAFAELCFEALGSHRLTLSISNACVTNQVVYTKNINVVDDGGPIH
ncbi:hypothetical protein [Niabella hibiscisoli]|uniref:hypothetical protein n=1 Tax=Niabella hibiscisoli TaxID=1825928 RepID=UPI001F111BC2|nr:hypothetical protein [Niabella hibiscisoli]MCH5718111.1 hypothetical protein [Niabella hibiscisoli]